MSAKVVGAGWHDICLRWDISTPQADERSSGGPTAETPSSETVRRVAERSASNANNDSRGAIADHWRNSLRSLLRRVSGGVFGEGVPSGRVMRIEREAQTVALAELVRGGLVTTAQFEQLLGFLDAVRMGLVETVYAPETARRRRTLAKGLGISANDSMTDSLDTSPDELLRVPRSAWIG